MKNKKNKKIISDIKKADDNINYNHNISGFYSGVDLFSAKYEIIKKNIINFSEKKNGKNEIISLSEQKSFANFSRFYEENDTDFQTIIKSLVNNSIGASVNWQTTTSNTNFNKKFDSYMRVWKRDCEFYSFENFIELLNIIVTRTFVDGEILAVFDNYFFENIEGKVQQNCTNRIQLIEVDYFIDFSPEELFNKLGLNNHFCENGKVINARRQIVGYLFSFSQEKENTTFIPESHAVLFGEKNHAHLQTRFLQTAGIMINQAQTFRVKQSIIKTVETNAQKSGVLKTRDNSPGVYGRQITETERMMMQAIATSEDEEEKKQLEDKFKNIKKTLSNTVDSVVNIGIEDDFILLDDKRPSSEVQSFLRATNLTNFSAVGMNEVFTGEIRPSYTAFRGGQVLAQQTFEKIRKKVERMMDKFLPFIYQKFTCDTGITLSDNERVSGRLIFPKMAEVDKSKVIKGDVLGLESGVRSPSEAIGANWREIIAEVAEFQNKCKELNLNPSGISQLILTQNETNQE